MILTRTDFRWMDDQRRNAALRQATAGKAGSPAGTGTATGSGHAGPLAASPAAAALGAPASCPASDRPDHPA